MIQRLLNIQNKKKLTYKNPKDNIPGRFLYDQEDVTDDYQVHAIYVLASDSKEKQYDRMTLRNSCMNQFF